MKRHPLLPLSLVAVTAIAVGCGSDGPTLEARFDVAMTRCAEKLPDGVIKSDALVLYVGVEYDVSAYETCASNALLDLEVQPPAIDALQGVDYSNDGYLWSWSGSGNFMFVVLSDAP